MRQEEAVETRQRSLEAWRLADRGLRRIHDGEYEEAGKDIRSAIERGVASGEIYASLGDALTATAGDDRLSTEDRAAALAEAEESYRLARKIGVADPLTRLRIERSLNRLSLPRHQRVN